MKKAILFFLLLLTLPYIRAQQHECGFDHLYNTVQSTPALKIQYDSIVAKLHRQIEEIGNRNVTQPNNYVIPVVFHLVGTNVSNAFSNTDVDAQLQQLNDAFANLLGSTQTVADDAQITFCYAQVAPNGLDWLANFNSTQPGITRITTAAANTVSAAHHMEPLTANGQQTLTNVVYFNPQNYLNIWVVEQISMQAPPNYFNQVFGYSPYPLTQGVAQGQFLDGIVVRQDVFGNPSLNPLRDRGLVMAHEAGHYLGLLHTYQNGCSLSLACNAPGGGDECCDTPPVFQPNAGCTPNNSCTETNDLPDMIENYMDRTTDQCRSTFTDDQCNRMHAAIQTFRPTLVSYPNLLLLTPACLNGLNPTFTSSTNPTMQICVGDLVTFNTAAATTYAWTFTGATTTSSTSQNPSGISWSTPGVYMVSLTVTDAMGNPASSTQQVFVTPCVQNNNTQANWYFGNHCSISFTTGSPVSVNPSAIITLESSASISDASGGLLFYTDGQAVYDNTHTAMPNGNNTLNGSPNEAAQSSAKGTVIVPRPGSSGRYFIYTTSDRPVVTTFNFGISQYEVDMALNSGLGDVVSTTPVFPNENYAMTECVVAIPHCNGTDYWLITKPVNNNQNGLTNNGPVTNSNQFIASYQVTSAGIANIPVMSSSGPYVPVAAFQGNNQWISQMSVSPDKKMIAITDHNSQDIFLYYFDCSSGILNYLTTLTGSVGYGLSFSPNSQVLYACDGQQILQYDLSTISQCNPNPPVISFDYFPLTMPANIRPLLSYSMQLGPDNKLYVARSGPPNTTNAQLITAAINFPDAINTSSTSNECGYNFNAVSLDAGQQSRLDLPNMIDGTTAPLADDFKFCISNCSDVCFVNMGCGVNFDWNFGDSYSISGANGTIPPNTNNGTTTGNFEYPCHTYAGPGTYTVTLSIDGRPVVTHQVIITPPPVPTITGASQACTTQQESYFGPLGFLYNWSAPNASPAAGNQQTFTTTWQTLPGVVTLTITDPATGCTSQNSMNVTPAPDIIFDNQAPSICMGESVTINVSGTAVSYSWSPATGLNTTTGSTVIATPATTTVYTVTATDGNGCVNSEQVTVTVTNGCSIGTVVTASTMTGNYTAQVFSVNADVTVTGTLTFTNCTLYMLENRRFIVPASCTLNIVGSWLRACTQTPCDGMWYGIEIQAGGVVNINGASVIEDAQNAIITQALTSGTRPAFFINTAVFNKNFIDIKTQQYTPGGGVANWSIKNTIFTCRVIPQTSIVNNTAYFNGTFKPQIQTITWNNPNTPYATTNTLMGGKSYAGVEATNNLMQVGTAGLAADLNVFDNHTYGIKLIDATGCTIKNNRFINMYGRLITSPVYPTGCAVYAINSNVNGTGGIIVGASTVNHRNYFKDVFRAVHIENYTDVTCSGNTFQASATMPAGFPTISDRAIHFEDIRSMATITSNTIENYFTAIEFWRNFQYQVSANPFITIKNNVLKTTSAGYMDYGITVDDIQQALPGANSSNISNNSITNANYEGIRVSFIKNDFTVESNFVQINYQGSSTNPVDAYGIIADHSNDININLNCVRTNYSGTYYDNTANWNIRGIYINTSPDFKMSCNSTYLLGRCVEIHGNSISSPSTAGGTKGFYNQYMNNCRTGLYITSTGQMGTQGSLSSPMGHRWTTATTANFYDMGVTYVENGGDASLNKIYCKNISADAYPTANHQPTAYALRYIAGTSIIATSGTSQEYTGCGTAPCGGDQQFGANNNSEAGSTDVSETQQENYPVNVYPNPNDGNMTLEYTLPQDADLEIRDAAGKLICTYALSQNENKIFMACSSMQNGVYTWQVILRNKTLHKTGKLVIIKP